MATIAGPGIAEVGEISTSKQPSRFVRALIAIAIGDLFGTLAWASQTTGRVDFGQIWYGASALLNGVSPYSVVGPGRAYPWEFPLLYPLPATIVGAPFALAPIRLATGLFVGCSAALLAFGITRKRWTPLLFFLTPPCLLAMLSAQWSMLLTAGALVPLVGFVFVAKPTVGAALWLFRPTKWALATGIVLVAASFLLQPHWMVEWMEALTHSGHLVMPIAHAGGPLLVLALSRWRRPEARLLLAMACVPQTALPYATVPLLLVPATLGESLVFVVLSYVAFYLWNHQLPYPSISDSIQASVKIVVPLLYLPCLVMVLRRPNTRDAPTQS